MLNTIKPAFRGKTIFLIIALCFISIQVSISQWQPEVRLTNDTSLTYNSYTGARSIAASGNYVHTTFTDNRAGNFDVYYKRSIDGGATFEADMQLTFDSLNSHNSAIAVSGSNVYIVWYDSRDGNRELYYSLSNDNGVTWSADTRLTNNPGESWHPSVTVNGSVVQIVWFDNTSGNNEIFYKRSDDGGNTWSTDMRLSNTAGSSNMPGIAVSGSNVHVSWYDSTNGNWEIYYKRSTDGGTSWGADTRLTNNSYVSYYPSIGVSGSTVHIMWTDTRYGNNDIFYKRSNNNGSSWGSDVRLTKNNFSSSVSSIAVTGSVIHLVFQQFWNTGWQIMYNRSSNGGVKWGNDAQITSGTGNSTIPSIAVYSSAVHLTFRDGRDGNPEIYYKRNLTGLGRPVEITETNSLTPSVYSLSQNYPNPFNPSTTIKFALPNNGLAKLVVYDALGRIVETLVNEQLNAGTYEAVWSAEKYSSGVYFYTLTSGAFSHTNKMLMIK